MCAFLVCPSGSRTAGAGKLSFDDLMHYQKVVVALKETIRLMGGVDKSIPGWPIE